MRFECRRAVHILALQVTLFDAVRHIAAGANVCRCAAERAAHHDNNPRAFRSASPSRIFPARLFADRAWSQRHVPYAAVWRPTALF